MLLQSNLWRSKNVRGALLAITNQYAGNNKWEAEIHKQDDLLHTRVWKGQSNFPLEGFIAQHCNEFISMQQCAEHIAYQLPNEHTRVGYLLEGIQCPNPGLQAAMVSVRTDDGANGMRSDFERSAAHLLPYDPIVQKWSAGSKQPAANISDTQGTVDANTSATEVSGTATKERKASISKTCIHLQYHTNSEYRALSTAQKRELLEWRDKNPEERKKKKPHHEKQKVKARDVSTAVARALADMMKPKQETDPTDVIVSSLLKVTISNTDDAKQAGEAAAVTDPSAETKRPPMTLKSILKQVKNGSP